MKMSLFRAAALFSAVVACYASRLAAQPPSAPPPATRAPSGVLIAVLDVSYVFQHHAGFQQAMEKIKQDVKAFESQVAGERQQISRQSEQLRQLEPGSPQYKQLEEAIARRVSDLQVRTQLKRKEVLDQEAQQYYATYNEVVGAVGDVARRYGIGLVLRYARNNIDPADQRSVLQGLNRTVVLQKNLDISDLVLQQIGQAARPAQARVPAAGSPIRR